MVSCIFGWLVCCGISPSHLWAMAILNDFVMSMTAMSHAHLPSSKPSLSLTVHERPRASTFPHLALYRANPPDQATQHLKSVAPHPHHPQSPTDSPSEAPPPHAPRESFNLSPDNLPIYLLEQHPLFDVPFCIQPFLSPVIATHPRVDAPHAKQWQTCPEEVWMARATRGESPGGQQRGERSRREDTVQVRGPTAQGGKGCVSWREGRKGGKCGQGRQAEG